MLGKVGGSARSCPSIRVWCGRWALNTPGSELLALCAGFAPGERRSRTARFLGSLAGERWRRAEGMSRHSLWLEPLNWLTINISYG